MRKILFSILAILTLITWGNVPNIVSAGLPSLATGRVYLQLPTGEQIPLHGVSVTRTDFDYFDYCESGQKCAGLKHQISVKTDSSGAYIFSNEKDSPNVSCFQNIPSGTRYACSPEPLGIEQSSNSELSECGRDLIKNYSSIYNQGFNWCGFFGASAPHKYQPVFAKDFVLPGNLKNLGYQLLGGTWKTVDQNDPNKLLESPYYEESYGSYANLYRRDFVYVLSPLSEIEVNLINVENKNSNDYAGCKSLTGIASGDGVEYKLSELPYEFNGTLLLTCIAEVQGSDASRIDFTFEKSFEGTVDVLSKSVSKDALVELSACSEGFKCYSATAEFEITGIGNYKVDSRVCNQNNLCSQ